MWLLLLRSVSWWHAVAAVMITVGVIGAPYAGNGASGVWFVVGIWSAIFVSEFLLNMQRRQIDDLLAACEAYNEICTKYETAVSKAREAAEQ